MAKTNNQLAAGFYQITLGFTNFRTTSDPSTTDWMVSFFRPPFAVGSCDPRSLLTAKWDGLTRGTNGSIRQFNFSTNDGSISVHWGLPLFEMCHEILESSVKVCFYKKSQRQNQFPNYKAYAFIPLGHVFNAKEVNNEKKVKGSAHIFMFKEESGAISLSKASEEDESTGAGFSSLEYELTLCTNLSDQTMAHDLAADCFNGNKKTRSDESVTDIKGDGLSKPGTDKKALISIDTLQQQNADMKILLNKALQEKDRLQKQISLITTVVKTKPGRSHK